MKIQISLRFRVVWPESSLCALWKAKYAKFFHAHAQADLSHWAEGTLSQVATHFIILSIYLNTSG